MAGDQPSLQEEFSCASHVPHSYCSLDNFSTIHLCRCLNLGRTRKYSHVVRALQPMMPTILLEDTIVIMRQSHPLPLDHVLLHIFDYQLEHTFVLNRTLFTHALVIIPHLSSNGLSGMVYEHLLGCFMFEDPSLGFSKLFQVVVAIVCGDILKLVALVLGQQIISNGKSHLRLSYWRR